MKLKRLKILSNFRGLPKNFEIKFNSESSNSNLMEPICFVGLNGSGKSNVMEVLSEIFYYLEWSSKVRNEEIKNKKRNDRLSELNKNIGFEIEYSIPQKTFLLKRTPWRTVDNYIQNTNLDPVFIVEKKVNEFPEVSLRIRGKKAKLSEENIRGTDFLPSRIIGYSSGMNELISNPYIKIDFSYFNDFQKKWGESSNSTLDMNRMFFMDYDSNKLVTICNFLFYNPDDKIIKTTIGPIKKELQIIDVHSFSIRIKFPPKERIRISSELHRTIDGLKKCATCVDDKTDYEQNIRNYDLDLFFWVNDSTKKAFKHHFYTSSELFRQLYFLHLTNYNLTSKQLRDSIADGGLDQNISSMLPKHEESKLLFSINDISFRKKSVDKPVYYKQLSDGEHQLLHVLGLVLLMDSPGTLFLLDEPETHFNPEWRSKFVSLMNECLGDDSRQQDMILTSHSPFIVSDCKPNKVYSFRRNRNNNVMHKKPDFNTFGASINLINFKVFGKKETISGLAKSKIENLIVQIKKNKINQNDAIKEIESLGDSIEKRIFLNNLNKN